MARCSGPEELDEALGVQQPGDTLASRGLVPIRRIEAAGAPV